MRGKIAPLSRAWRCRHRCLQGDFGARLETILAVHHDALISLEAAADHSDVMIGSAHLYVVYFDQQVGLDSVNIRALRPALYGPRRHRNVIFQLADRNAYV